MVIKGLKVSSKKTKSNEWLHLPKAFTKPSLTMDRNDIAPPLKFKKQKYLHEIIGEFDENENIFVELGANCINVFKPTDISQRRKGGIYALQKNLVGVLEDQ